ncbi:stage V sporulation protein B, partial [Candidatus Magnetoovum chiemensis]
MLKEYKKITRKYFYSRFDDNIKGLFSGFVISFITQVIGAALGFIVTVVLSRTLGANGAGVYFLALTVINFAVVIGRFGLFNSALRFAAENAAVKNWRAVKGIYRKTMIFSLLSSILVTLAVFILSPIISIKVFSQAALAEPLNLMALS